MFSKFVQYVVRLLVRKTDPIMEDDLVRFAVEELGGVATFLSEEVES